MAAVEIVQPAGEWNCITGQSQFGAGQSHIYLPLNVGRIALGQVFFDRQSQLVRLQCPSAITLRYQGITNLDVAQ